MLYERWRQVVRDRGKATALWEAESGQRWTFAQLDRTAEESFDRAAGGWSHPTGMGAEFILEVLRGWRAGAVVCPLEPGQQPARLPYPPPGIVHLKTTSATTGDARAVAFRAEQLAADVDQIRLAMGLRPDWPNLAAISLAHSYGFSNLVLPLLLAGIPLVLCGSALPEALRRAAAVVPDATLPGVPVLWRSWLEVGAIPTNLRLAISAGAPLPLPLEQAIHQRHGLKVHNFYGATECGGIAFDRSSKPRSDSALAGQPLEGVALSVDDACLLQVRGGAVGETYWPEAETALAGGVYRTNDLAELIDAGVRLCGRAGDLIHVAGRKVAPETIERALLQHPAVHDCLVLGVPSADDARVEAITAVVVTSAEAPEQVLRAHLASLLPPWQVPRIWHRVDSLDASDRGKPSRRTWRERLGNPGQAA
jgi:long-chain acyl-CoA synthetase